jgi:hypothetical protein
MIKKFLILSIFFLIFINYINAMEEDYSVAYINDYEGECEIKRKGKDISEAISDIYVPLYEGDVVITGMGSIAEIIFDDSTIVRLDPESKILIKDLTREKNKKTIIDLLKGKIIAIVKKLIKEEEFTVKTKMAMAAVKGTEFIVETGDEEKVGVYEGQVEVSGIDLQGNVLHKVIVGKDKETVISKKLRGPEKPRNLSKNFIKRFKEVKDLREKIEMIRELRAKGNIKEYKLKRRIQKIENIKMMMRNNPQRYKNLTEGQRKLVDKLIQMQPYLEKQLDDIKRKEREQRMKVYLKEKKKEEKK